MQIDHTFVFMSYRVKSLIDRRGLDGVPSIRVHNGTDYMGGLRFIRWTEVFILQVVVTTIIYSYKPLILLSFALTLLIIG